MAVERTFRAREVSSSTRAADVLDHVLRIGILGLVLAAPLAFGAVEDWAVLGLELGAALLVLIWAARQLLAGCIEIAPRGLLLPCLLFGVVVGAQLLFRTSAYPAATASEAQRFTAYGALLFLTLQAFQREADLKTLGIVISAVGFAIAVFAIAQDLTPNGKIYWLRGTHSGQPFGPYVNKNHYAGLLELLTPVPLLLALDRSISTDKRVLLTFVAAVMGASLLMSKSRGGIIAFAAELVVLATLLLRKRGTLRAGVALVVACAVMLGFVLWLDSSRVVQRVASLQRPLGENVTGHRLTIAKDAGHMFLQRPVMGWGLHAFPAVYPQFRTYVTTLFVNEAHNDYMQLLAETGIAGTLAMAWFLIVLFRDGYRSSQGWLFNRARSIKLAALLGCFGLLVHGFTDFNFHIPANVAVFILLCGVAAVKLAESSWSVPIDRVRAHNQ